MPVATDDRRPAATPHASTRDAATLATAESAARGEGKRDYVQQMFSEIAPRYDLLNHVLSLNIDRAWRRKALQALRWMDRPQGTYLDLCAGTLDIGAMLTKLPGFGGFVVGADFAVPMLRHGNGKAPRSVLSPVGADALALPLANASVDGAIVAFGIRNVADLDAGLREVLRVVRPGGRFVILECSTPSLSIVRAGYHAYFHYVLPRIGRVVSGHRSAYSYLPMSVAHFPTGDDLAQRMRLAGFQTVTWKPLTLGVAAIHVGVVPAAAPADSGVPRPFTDAAP